MLARIYQPARTAMQSGQAKTHVWLLEFVPEQAKRIDPLMGWTGSGDMNRQVTLRFDSKDAAVTYAERHGIAYRIEEPKPRKHILRRAGYGDNFASNRRNAWTH
ncbi:ETC complex I subunit [Oceanomicrobium pacificus]|uniref:ETC complex I subunit n=1 Tax=Oceanomicrobium pacificus TaxID=2692916 RepID=A0A6B0TS30_9RHOB|nr:ETC complex I subunit [Oceanomicrobium pacificus]MXU64615.1 ETC complex I subunit [Oceanomicrobium pacificus]